jgi:nitroreductase
MDKTASTQHALHSLIAQRWSPRSFDPKTPISPEDAEALFEAAGWAASSMNEQPWRYYFAHRSDEEGFQDLLDCLVDGNQVWAKNAAVLIAISYRENFEKNDKENVTAKHDTGLANANLVLEALSRNIYAHMMGGYHKDKTIDLLQMQDESPVCFMALGYLDDPEALPNDKLRDSEKAKRTRKPLDEIITHWQGK